MIKICGICGLVNFKEINKEQSKMFETVLINCESRGRDAFGYYNYPSGKLYKQKGCVTEYLKNHRLARRFKDGKIILAHTRQETTGSSKRNRNNHPFETQDFVLAHNGVIWNYDKFKFKTDIETDSVVIIKDIQEGYEKKKDVVKAIQNTTRKITGSYACWLLHKPTGDVYLFRHNNPIEIGLNYDEGYIVFASEKGMFDWVEKPSDVKGFNNTLLYGDIEEGWIYKVDELGLAKLDEFKAVERSYNDSYSKDYGNNWIRDKNGVYTTLEDEDLEEEEDMDNLRIIKSKFEQPKFNTIKELDNYMIEENSMGISYIEHRLNPWGIKITTNEGKVILSFEDDDIYKSMKEKFKKEGFEISPNTHQLKLSFVDDLVYIVDIFEEGW